MENKFELNEEELERVIGGLGMSNPVSELTEEEALKIAEKLGDGKDMGSWRTMSGEEFMKWWRNSHEKVGGICGYNSTDNGSSYPGGVCG